MTKSKATHGLVCRHVDSGVTREIEFNVLDDNSVHIVFMTKWKESEEPVCTPLLLTPIAAELLAEGMFQLAHHRDKWKLQEDKQEEDSV